MKTLQQLYTEIISSDELKKAYLEAAKGGKTAEFLKANGCEATEEEIKAFLQEEANKPLSDDELDSVAGGCNEATGTEAALSVLTAGALCGTFAIVSAIKDKDGVPADMDPGRLCSYVKSNR